MAVCVYCVMYLLAQEDSDAVSWKTVMTASSAGDENVLDKSPSLPSVDAAAVSQQLSEMSLTADVSHDVDKVLTENCSGSDTAAAVDEVEAADAVADSHTRCWTSDGLMGERLGDTASDDVALLTVGDQLTSADNDCGELSVGSFSSQQMTLFSGSDLASVNHATHCGPACDCYLDNNESPPFLSEDAELFSCHECSITYRKHFAHDSLHVVLHVIRHSEVDCSVFGGASLTVVQNETYLTKVIKRHNTFEYCHYVCE